MGVEAGGGGGGGRCGCRGNRQREGLCGVEAPHYFAVKVRCTHLPYPTQKLPLSVAVPSPLSVNVTPAGRLRAE